MKNIAITNVMIIGFAFFLSVFFSACKGDSDYKVTRQQVMDLHDKLMIDGEMAMHNKMALDTLAIKGLANLKRTQHALDTLKEKTQIAKLTAKLNTADERMMDWMNKFQPDVDGKNNAEAIAYFTKEKVKLIKMDSLYKIALKESSDYLKKFNLEVPAASKGHDHSKH
jgi:hypothetical protein